MNTTKHPWMQLIEEEVGMFTTATIV